MSSDLVFNQVAAVRLRAQAYRWPPACNQVAIGNVVARGGA
jgi:hypothetical protein